MRISWRRTAPAEIGRREPDAEGANQAVAAARLGGDVARFGCLGDDAFADRLIEDLNQNAVHTTCIRRVAGVSTEQSGMPTWKRVLECVDFKNPDRVAICMCAFDKM